ncbi:MAG: DNA polymerase III subunit delta [Mastigocoleus sp.]
MPVYVYWGEDDFAIEKAVSNLRDRIIDEQWASFNYTAISPDEQDAVTTGLNQVMTPKFGAGGRLVWLIDTTLAQQCSEKVLAELKRTLCVIPEDSFLLITSKKKLDARLKSTKLLKENAAQFQEFPLIPPWKIEIIEQNVIQEARKINLKLTSKSVKMIASSVGNNTRLLYNELEKLRLFTGESNEFLDTDIVSKLVRNTTQSSLQLAAAINSGDTAKALKLVADLINAHEPALRIVATLVAQYRTWLQVKVMVDSGERNQKAIAQFAEVGNPKRVYFLEQEVRSFSVEQLVRVLPILLDLEVALKKGATPMSKLQTTVIELCLIK